MLRAIKEISPRWVVGENVRGLTNWNGGLVFDEVQADLEAQGYEVLPFLLPACAVNAPHRRDRIWFVANRNSNGFNECNGNNEINTSEGRINAFGNINESNGNGDVANTNFKRLQQSTDNGKVSRKEETLGRERSEFTIKSVTINKESNVTYTNGFGFRRESNWIGESRFFNKKSKKNNWQNFPTVSPICNGNDGLSDRLDNITFSKWRNESIKAGGNAIVPQVVYQIFKSIEQYEK